MADNDQGTPFGRYQLMERIAMGGMAEVFRARVNGPDGFEKDVCIKRILPQFCQEEDFVRMFIDEAKLAARLQHANIVQVFDFAQVDGAYFLAMEYVAGKDLRAVIKQGFSTAHPPGPYRAATVVAEMCRGLHHAHTKEGLKLVHRDVSPHNVMVSLGGEVKVMDFGIAKATDRITRTTTGIIKGKIAYMAPEQAGGGELDHRVDQFATGLVLFELLTGKRAYEGAEPTALRRALEGDVEPPSLRAPDIPPELDEIFMKACARDPQARYADMRALERALQGFIYRRAPDDDELDLARYMNTLFGKAVRAKTAVLVDTRDLAPPPPDPRHVSVPSVAAPTASASRLGKPRTGVGTGEETQDPAAAEAVAALEPLRKAAAPEVPAPRPVSVTDATSTAMGTPTPMAPPAPKEPVVVPPPAPSDEEAQTPRKVPLLALGALVALGVAGVGGVAVSGSRGEEKVPVVQAPVAAAVPEEKPAPPAAAPVEKEALQAPVKAAEPEVEKAQKGPKGRVKVVISSGWAQVWMRGKMVLEETPGEIALDPGKYTLTLKNPENGHTQNASVVVKSNQTTRLVRPAP